MIADALGRSDDAEQLARSRDEFRGDLYASIRRRSPITASTTCQAAPSSAISTRHRRRSRSRRPVSRRTCRRISCTTTFERYWTQFEARRDGSVAWKDYTPYEWRTVSTVSSGLAGAIARRQAIDFFMHDRRPAEWNQWAEVVGRDPRESRFVGDMPHGWVASDFIRSVLDLFAYEREADQSLVIAAGVPAAWLDGDGIAIEHLRTPFGALSYALVRRDGRLRLEISGEDFRMPAGGIVFAPPAVASDASCARSAESVTACMTAACTSARCRRTVEIDAVYDRRLAREPTGRTCIAYAAAPSRPGSACCTIDVGTRATAGASRPLSSKRRRNPPLSIQRASSGARPPVT